MLGVAVPNSDLLWGQVFGDGEATTGVWLDCPVVAILVGAFLVEDEKLVLGGILGVEDEVVGDAFSFVDRSFYYAVVVRPTWGDDLDGETWCLANEFEVFIGIVFFADDDEVWTQNGVAAYMPVEIEEDCAIFTF